jgi:hypothetical protein
MSTTTYLEVTSMTHARSSPPYLSLHERDRYRMIKSSLVPANSKMDSICAHADRDKQVASILLHSFYYYIPILLLTQDLKQERNTTTETHMRSV